MLETLRARTCRGQHECIGQSCNFYRSLPCLVLHQRDERGDDEGDLVKEDRREL